MYKNGLFIALLTILICQSSLFAKESLFYASKTLDIPLAIISASTALTGLYFIKDTEVPNSIKDKLSLLPWDKPFAGTYSENADLWSDILNVGLLFPIAISGTALAQNDIQKNDFWKVLLMYSEALALQSGLNLLTRSFQLWPRPYLYKNGKAEKAKGEAYGSFYSGHVSAAFTSAVFTSYLFHKIYPNSKYKTWVTAASFTLASAVAVLRIAAGKHYPTDVIAGALAGSGISLGVIALHEHFKSDISVSAAPGFAVVSFSF